MDDALEALAAAGVGDLPALIEAPAWQRWAACIDADPELFFSGDPDAVCDALEVCDDCPVVDACREFALEHGEVGVWGGTTDAQRRAISRGEPAPARPERSRQGAPATPDRRCGTRAGYMRHWRSGEQACEGCLEAQGGKRHRRRAAA